MPKQARALATRHKLLDATVHTLCELGYSGTTTTEVAHRAEVSQGALYKHFGSKHQLIADTIEHLFTELIEKFRAKYEASTSDSNKLSRALQELWSIFMTPELYAVLELYIAARTNRPLRDALRPVLFCHRQNLVDEACRLFPEASAENPRFAITVDGLISAMQGAAISAAVLPEISEGTEVVQFLEYICRRELEPPYGEPK